MEKAQKYIFKELIIYKSSYILKNILLQVSWKTIQKRNFIYTIAKYFQW